MEATTERVSRQPSTCRTPHVPFQNCPWTCPRTILITSYNSHVTVDMPLYSRSLTFSVVSRQWLLDVENFPTPLSSGAVAPQMGPCTPPEPVPTVLPSFRHSLFIVGFSVITLASHSHSRPSRQRHVRLEHSAPVYRYHLSGVPVLQDV